MSADRDMQHFGVPGEPGAPGTARIRRAHKALAAWRDNKGKSGYTTRGDALAAALEEFLPTYTVIEAIKGADIYATPILDFLKRFTEHTA